MITLFHSVLFYTNKLKVLKRFYENVLELTIADSSHETFTVKIGDSNITFKQSERPACYHFALNIPGNQFSLMKLWIKERIPLLREGGMDQFYSQSFDADLMYFEDPAGNVIKLMGRRHRDLFGNLTSDAFLNVSEVSLITPFVEEIGDQLQDFGIPLHYGVEVDPDHVNYLGKGETFIAIKAPVNKKIFSHRKETHPHPLEITLDTGGKIKLDEVGHISLTAAKEDSK